MFGVLAPEDVKAKDAPRYVTEFADKYCSNCHGESETKGEFRFDKLPWDLTDSEARAQWNLVREYVSSREMPPADAPQHPSVNASKEFLSRLEVDFARADQEAEPGGTPIRRLNRVEYLNTVRDLFGMRMIKLPASFPADAPNADFDTMPAGLFLSPAVMEAYHDVATDIANRFVPLPGGQRYESALSVEEIGGDATRRWFSPDREHLKFVGLNHSGWAGALWDALFIAPESGTYKVHLLARAQSETGADGQPLRLVFYAFDPTEEQLPKRYLRHRAAEAGAVAITQTEFQWSVCEIQVEAGETFHVYCDNRFAEGTFPELPINRRQVNEHVKSAKKRSEPTIELKHLKVEGPVGVNQRVEDFFDGYPPRLDRQELEQRLMPLATRAYRRPLNNEEEQRLVASVLGHAELRGSSQLAWHYAIRRILCSPAFLYRESEAESAGRHLSEHALATRLSYTLWSTMPDDELRRWADRGQLSDPEVLRSEVQRLLDDPRSAEFVKHFCGQWLGNRTVEAINICDNRYQWHDAVRYGFVRSTEMFFDEVLRENLPIATFIDSDFTYANNAMQFVWGLSEKGVNLDTIARDQRQSLIWPEPERLSLAALPSHAPRHIRQRGGILGLPGVLTVTGDGVESSPILRGVWVLENLFGMKPPPPPKNVPALDVDTSLATNVRDTLAAHRELESCAKCHKDIDPLGLALENYDAIGGWRQRYVGDEADIDATAVMPNGTLLDGPASVKVYLLEHRELFTRCLLTKLLEYGSGRELSIGDLKIVSEIVEAEPEDGYRFRDLIEVALTSDVFLSK